MASLDRLTIRGIRSFDDKGIQWIQFFSPVTVIVGHNGSGKTTIIECLKYATTGDQPPNTRGGAFIHDPKLANEKEVKASVRLKFHAASGSIIEASRNLSVTVKKNGAMTMKTLEGLLKLKDIEGSGKRATISTKCAEMDVEIPQLLGVSKAVLENVIFCHQEDSYWPLAEPSALKKKFDDIFEATKYTKALDAIKSLRKEKVQELKTEKEKLESLAREKTHFDKLRSRISDLTAQIAAKTIEREEVEKQHELQMASNSKFYESSTKFREIYIKVDSLTSAKQRYEEELEALKETLQELAGTDEELRIRFKNFDSHVIDQRRKKAAQEAQISDLKDEMESTRKQHSKKVNEHGQLLAEAKAHETVLQDREQLIKDLAARYSMKGFEAGPLDRDQVLNFITRITESQQRLNVESEDLKAEQKRKSDEYNARYRQLHSEREGFRSRKRDLQERSATLRSQVKKDQLKVDDAEGLTSEYKTVEADIEEKESRIQRARKDFKDAKFDEHINERTAKRQELYIRHQSLTEEMAAINKQVRERSDLDHTRGDLKRKESDLKNALAVSNPKFRKFAGTDAKPETMEREMGRLHVEKETKLASLENAGKTASKNVQNLEANLLSFRAQVKEKSEEITLLDKQIKDSMDTVTDLLPSDPREALSITESEVSISRGEVIAAKGAGPRLEEFKKLGKEKKCCPLCDRHMNSQELRVFETKVDDELVKSTPASIKETEKDLAEWERILQRLQIASQRVVTRDKLKNTEIPALEIQIKQTESELSEAKVADEEASQRVGDVRKELEELLSLKHQAATISKTQQDMSMLKREISTQETALLAAGSTKTTEEVQAEVEPLKAKMDGIDRDLKSLATQKERQINALRQQEDGKHILEMKQADLKSKLRDKAALEDRIKEMKKEIEDAASTIKELDVRMSEVDPVIERLEQEHQVEDQELSSKIVQAQRAAQELNIGVDKLNSFNKVIERYVRDKRDRRLEECSAKIEELEDQISELKRKLDDATKTDEALAKEIHESTATVANLRDNLRARKLVKEIADTQAEIDQYDLEEAAKAKRLFEEKYTIEKEKETALQSKVAHISGELSSFEQQLGGLQTDLKEYKDINKQYRDQLIKVKLSDMANNDLEKYAKALDSAIMKYHSLKMEEVNDTMRHLWNKTYQGTDIDGIKICSDSETATGNKRSYNYRVVMTKDQVEMDMRGRCSAGQKMLASIIIRLALADSFGQNCGILALDEPTNALDTENIAALASSLGDIINERKHHSNFQLIIITHDEQFLRKLGETTGIHEYWRVERDSKQKSIIKPERLSDRA